MNAAADFELGLASLDLRLMAAYLAAIVALGCWAGLRQRRRAAGQAYFLAGRTLTWPLIGLALFASSISSLELVSLAEEGYRSGLVYGNLQLMAPLCLLLLALFFAPFYIRCGVTTLPDFLEQRFGAGSRRALVVLSIASAIFIHLSFALFTGGKVIEGLFGIDLQWAIASVLGLAGLYTIIGGLRALVVTSALQAATLVGGSALLLAVALWEVGGWSGLTAALASEPARLSLLRSSDVEPDMAWHAVLLGYPVIGTWYWCTDQTIVQRVLGAKDEQHAQVGSLLAGFLMLLSLFLLVLPGTICYALVKQGRLSELADTAQTLPYLITTLLPTGIKGIFVAALLSASMSTTAGALNSIATLAGHDIYRELRPAATEGETVTAGRIVTIAAMLLAFIWVPKIGNFGSILACNTAMICSLAPSITAVFVWGVLWRGASKTGALTTLISGSLLGLIMFLLEWNKEITGWNLSFMMGSFYLFVVSSAILGVASWWVPPDASATDHKLVWNNLAEVFRSPGWHGLLNYKLLSILLLLAVGLVYIALP